MSVSRPKTVMNHGMPAAGSVRRRPRRRASAATARSATDGANDVTELVPRRSEAAARAAARRRATPGRAPAPRRSGARPARRARPRRRATRATSSRSSQHSRGASCERGSDDPAPSTSPRCGEHDLRAAAPSVRLLEHELACARSSKRAGRGGGSGRRVQRVAEREVVLLDADDVREVASRSPARGRSETGSVRLVADDHMVLHAVADEAVSRDRERVLRQARRRAGCGGRTRPRSTRPCPTRAGAAARR